MRKSVRISSFVIVLILSYTVVAPYQYSMTALQFYAVTTACLLLSCLYIILFSRKITLGKGVGVVFF
ncbi:hypothetical protein AB4Z22_05435, partial [Paenibacillus sp. TAF58]